MRGFLLAATAVVLATGCSGSDSGGSSSEKIETLVVAPDGATIDTGTTLQLRATGRTASGRFIDVTDVEWTASAGTISADGLFTPAGASAGVTITAEAAGHDGEASVAVVEPGTLSVTVVDAASGLPIAGAEISLVTSSAGVLTIGDGTATLSGASGTIDVQVVATNFHPMTIYGLKTKVIRIPLRPENPPPGGFFEGVLDFTEAYNSDTPEPGSLWIGIGGPGIKGNILAFGLDSLLGPTRPVNISGFELDAPSNLYVHGFTDPYIASAPAGETVAFGLGGEVEISAITDVIAGGTSDLGEVIAELLPIFNTFHYSTRENVTVASNQTLPGQDMALTQSLSKRATLNVGPRPWTDPNPLVVAALDFGTDLGFVPAGLNIVDGETETVSNIQVPPLSGDFEDKTYVFLVVSQEGGLGASTDQQVAVLSRGHTRVSNVVTPDFLTPPSIGTFSGNGATLTFDYGVSAGADFLFHTFARTLSLGTDGGGNPITETYEWDVVAPGDSDGFVLPMVLATSGAQAGGSWTVQSLGLQSQTYDSLFTPNSPIDASSYFNDANRVVITNADVD